MPGPLLSCRIHYNQYNQYNQCYIDFVDIDARDLSKTVKERLAIPVPRFDSFADPEPHNFPTDKWLLSSALQKLVRRGLPERAVEIALALHALDPHYLPKRLPIIAFEDVGIGNLEACFDTLHLFGTRRFPAKTGDLDQRKLLANLVYRLARSVKSRAACDILCLALANSELKTATELANSGAENLISLAADRKAADVTRALALYLLCGRSVGNKGPYRTLPRFNADVLNALIEKLELPSVIAWMLIKGRNRTGLAAMLPLAWEAIAEGVAGLEVKRLPDDDSKALAEKQILGVPACAADMYTRVGRQAIMWFSEVVKREYRGFFEAFPEIINHSNLLGMAIFHFEGSRLGRWLENETIAKYREHVERAELQGLGVPDSESHQELYQILETERQLLWQIRKAHLYVAFGTDK